MSSVSGLDRLVSVPHAMMQANESLYIDDFNLESLQIQQIQQIQLPDMDALRLELRGYTDQQTNTVMQSLSKKIDESVESLPAGVGDRPLWCEALALPLKGGGWR